MHWAFEVQLKSKGVAEFCIKRCLIIPSCASKPIFTSKLTAVAFYAHRPEPPKHPKCLKDVEAIML